jgi:hypothetical protein
LFQTITIKNQTIVSTSYKDKHIIVINSARDSDLEGLLAEYLWLAFGEQYAEGG